MHITIQPWLAYGVGFGNGKRCQSEGGVWVFAVVEREGATGGPLLPTTDVGVAILMVTGWSYEVESAGGKEARATRPSRLPFLLLPRNDNMTT